MSTLDLSSRIARTRASLGRYRALAWVTGVFLLVLCVELVLKYVVRVSDDVMGYVSWIPYAHGWIYVVYLVTVVDLWAGPADKDGQEMWQEDTLLNLFSCTKTFAAVATLQLVGEGKLELDAPVARYWPEFAAAGKERITVRQLLCHHGGVCCWCG